ncbi:SNF2-related protein [Lachnobacterium bovis]|uniref:DEAD/DEAH box helicase n=1 Tax=Lachnobacterium bovis TaxID=140626 RepID=UPI0006868E1D|nr:SNF2-related protein [Lachnobacterium bovis]
MSEINVGDVVKVVSNNAIGAVIKILKNGTSTTSYEVLVNGEKLLLDVTQLVKADGNNKSFETRNEFDAYLSSLAISNPGKDLYSIKSANIDFIPYQYRPVLKMIKSDQPRILIADDVGVGKTIEAGLIVKELTARQSMNNIMIFCPRPLVAEGKWQNEMKNKFGEKFAHIDRKKLKMAIKECDYEGEWPDEYGRCIIPYSILDEQLLGGIDEPGKKKELGLLDLNPSPKFDLVIVDEAHHIRNQNTQAYQVIQYFCMHAEAVVFLTATPIQLGDRDLFVLLNLLRPDYIIDEDTYKSMAEPNPYINKAIDIVRGRSEDWRDNAISLLTTAQGLQWSNRTTLSTQLADLCVKIANASDDSKDRVEIISSLEKLHTFSNIINRTRKRDIGNFTTRKPVTVRCDFTPQQQKLYDELIDVQSKILSSYYNESMIKFLMSTLFRQAASCIFGLAPSIEDILTRHISLDGIDESVDESDANDAFANEDCFRITVSDDIKNEILRVVNDAKNIDIKDNKLDALIKIIREKNNYDNNKIMIFSAFRHTLNYLYKHLRSENYRVGLVTGSTKDEERIYQRERFMKNKSDEEALDILLFSEVGCEGLDYQFCDCMINYDLPWNPMRIEQRIGRIDRNGQKSDSVLIYNMITDGTIDADIYDRCLTRIGIFNESLGCGELILGELTKEIQNIAVNYKLTEEEKRDKLVQLSDNKIRLLNENRIMEENQYDFLSIRMPFDDDKENIKNNTGKWMTVEKVENLINEWLKKSYSKELIKKNESIFVSLSKIERSELLSKYKKMKYKLSVYDKEWVNYLKGTEDKYYFSFDAELAKRIEVNFVGLTHPLTIMASYDLAESDKKFIRLKARPEMHLEKRIDFAIYEWRYIGEHNNSQLKIIADEEYSEIIEKLILESSVITGGIPVEIDKFYERQQALWSEERQEFIEKQKDIFNRREESLKISYQHRLDTIKRQELLADNANITRMKKKEYENVMRDLDARLEEQENKKLKVDLLSKFVCAGSIEVSE